MLLTSLGNRKGTLASVVGKLQSFRIPDYDDVDRCDFCDDTKGRFTVAVELVKEMQKERLWGLCLDCFRGSGAFTGECRYGHPNAQMVNQ